MVEVDQRVVAAAIHVIEKIGVVLRAHGHTAIEPSIRIKQQVVPVATIVDG